MCRTLKQKGGEEAEVVAVLNQRHISHRMESEHLFIFNFHVVWITCRMAHFSLGKKADFWTELQNIWELLCAQDKCY